MERHIRKSGCILMSSMQQVIWLSWTLEGAHDHPQKDKSFSCVQCHRSFGQAVNLKTLMLIHSGVKTHTCSEFKSFGRGDILKKHIITHTTNMCRMWRGTDMIFVKNFTQPDFKVKNFTPVICDLFIHDF